MGTCFKCGLHGHGRADCPWTDEEARDLRRAQYQAQRQAAMKCFKCRELGHAKADCPSTATEVHSKANEVMYAISEASHDASTVATALDLPTVVPEPSSCSFCGATQTQVRARN